MTTRTQKIFHGKGLNSGDYMRLQTEVLALEIERDALVKALQQANKLLFARGALLGSDNYFAIRHVLVDALKAARANCDVVLIDDPLNAHPR